MRNERAKKRSLVFSAAVHSALIVLLLVLALCHGCFSRKKPLPKLVFVDIALPPPPPPPAPEPPPPEPLPPPKPPEPKPEPKPAPKPEPPKTNAPPKKRDIRQTNRVTRTTAPTPAPPPKTQPPNLKDIFKPTPGTPTTPSAPAFSPTEYSLYLSTIRNTLHAAWKQPPLNDPSLVTTVSLTISADGRFTASQTSGSGNATMDASVMHAVGSVYKLPPLPKSLQPGPFQIDIDFALQN